MCQLISIIYLNKYHFAIALFLISQKISTTNKSTTVFEITLSEPGLTMNYNMHHAGTKNHINHYERYCSIFD